jgi:hypothetical protein
VYTLGRSSTSAGYPYANALDNVDIHASIYTRTQDPSVILGLRLPSQFVLLLCSSIHLKFTVLYFKSIILIFKIHVTFW